MYGRNNYDYGLSNREIDFLNDMRKGYIRKKPGLIKKVLKWGFIGLTLYSLAQKCDFGKTVEDELVQDTSIETVIESELPERN